MPDAVRSAGNDAVPVLGDLGRSPLHVLDSLEMEDVLQDGHRRAAGLELRDHRIELGRILVDTLDQEGVPGLMSAGGRIFPRVTTAARNAT